MPEPPTPRDEIAQVIRDTPGLTCSCRNPDGVDQGPEMCALIATEVLAAYIEQRMSIQLDEAERMQHYDERFGLFRAYTDVLTLMAQENKKDREINE